MTRWRTVVSGGAAVAAAAAIGVIAGLATASASPATTQAVPVAPVVPAGPSPLIYPAETIPIKFDHAAHARLGATCEGCHTAATTSAVAGDNLIPGEAACRGCHKIDRATPGKTVGKGEGPARCDACHVDSTGNGWMPVNAVSQPPRVALVRPNLKFNHRLHAARGIGCELCHASAPMQAMVTRADLPMMASCLTCHNGKHEGNQATARCGACHPTQPDGRLQVKLASPATIAAGGSGLLQPSGSLRGFDAHGPTFRRDHAQAGRDESYCLTCHRRNECIDCHGGVVKPPDIHPADYVTLHVQDARRNVPDCSSCHRLQTFCIGCHQRLGVASDPSGGQPGRKPNNPFGTGTGVKQFHPPGWARDAAGMVISTPRPQSHSIQAKRNIRTCVSCHREESCLSCHSNDPTRGPNVSPHGPNFSRTNRCRFLAARNQRACLKCHAVGMPELDCE
jgi:Cytochrome c7 and related cytochrome c